MGYSYDEISNMYSIKRYDKIIVKDKECYNIITRILILYNNIFLVIDIYLKKKDTICSN